MSESEKRAEENAANRSTNLHELLDPNKILMAEFEYARETASQAMEDRHKMVNYFLIIVGVLLNAVATLLTSEKKLGESLLGERHLKMEHASSILLLFLFIIGLVYLFKLIRLRIAWYDSAVAMNKIKDYYDDNLKSYKLKSKAFQWTMESLKKMKLNKSGTLFYYSALLVMLISTVALCGALLFLGFQAFIIAVFFLLGFALQFALYKTKLKVTHESKYKKNYA